MERPEANATLKSVNVVYASMCVPLTVIVQYRNVIKFKFK